MGGVEDDEPPTKRVKVSLGGKMGLANNSSRSEPATGSLYNSMARPLPSDGGNEEMVGSKGIIKRMEFVRIITEALYSLGYEKSGSLLEEESGIPLHSSRVGLLRKQVLNGNWEESVVTLRKIGILEETTLKSASFLILEQKFFELLGKERVMEALQTLRTEITPLSINVNRVHELSSCVVYSSLPKSVGSSNGEAVSGKSRSKLLDELQKLLPPAVMIPERRLENLVEQSLNVQRGSCVFHNSLDSALSLFSDHQCGKDQIPSRTLQLCRVANVNGLQATFLRSGNSGVTLFHSISGDAEEAEKRKSEDTSEGDKLNQDAALAMGKGAATQELLNLPLPELERRCRHNGLSLVGGRKIMVARLLSLEEADKQRGYDREDDMKYAQVPAKAVRYSKDGSSWRVDNGGHRETNFGMERAIQLSPALTILQPELSPFLEIWVLK